MAWVSFWAAQIVPSQAFRRQLQRFLEPFEHCIKHFSAGKSTRIVPDQVIPIGSSKLVHTQSISVWIRRRGEAVVWHPGQSAQKRALRGQNKACTLIYIHFWTFSFGSRFNKHTCWSTLPPVYSSSKQGVHLNLDILLCALHTAVTTVD